jgi:hypothetical protein
LALPKKAQLAGLALDGSGNRYGTTVVGGF